MKKRNILRRVALGHRITLPWTALFVCGVSEYAKRHGGWIITTSPPAPTGGPHQSALNAYTLKGWSGDGAILAIASLAEARAARRLGIPVVNLSGSLHKTHLPRVMVDDFAIGRLAADHLLERGLRRLAYFGTAGYWYSQQRGQGFAERAKQAGVPCEISEMPNPANVRTPWHNRVAPLARWLQRLERPVGILAAHDHLARVVIDECRQLNLDVPHDVAVIGSDNDTIVCEYCEPTLSSVSRNAWRIGYEAAALLDSLMSGKKAPTKDILIPPDGVIARQSTDTVNVDDAHVAAAVRFMRDHMSEACNVARVSKHVSVSRRQLELRFRRALGRSPHDFLCRLRVEAARRLLERPENAKFQTIAVSCGFSGVEHLCQAFHRMTGMTPLEYHRQCQLHRLG
jgi:LacI family transcriptional regulator